MESSRASPSDVQQSSKPVILLPCACANLRRAARIVTQSYEEAFRTSGLRATQFTLLQALHLAPGISQKQLAELLGADSTTLTRTLALLRRKGWIRSKPGNDRREVRLSLTAAGQREYRRVLPFWRLAQKRLRQALGEAGWKHMLEGAVLSAEIASRPRK